MLLGADTALITSVMLEPIVASVQGNVPALVGVGISLMAIMVGIGMIPRIVYKFL